MRQPTNAPPHDGPLTLLVYTPCSAPVPSSGVAQLPESPLVEHIAIARPGIGEAQLPIIETEAAYESVAWR